MSISHLTINQIIFKKTVLKSSTWQNRAESSPLRGALLLSGKPRFTAADSQEWQLIKEAKCSFGKALWPGEEEVLPSKPLHPCPDAILVLLISGSPSYRSKALSAGWSAFLVPTQDCAWPWGWREPLVFLLKPTQVHTASFFVQHQCKDPDWRKAGDTWHFLVGSSRACPPRR